MTTNTSALDTIAKAFPKNFQKLKSHSRNALTILLTLVSFGAFSQTTLGPYELQTRDKNPLREPITFLYRHTPVAIDWDKDGDFDIAVADFDGGNGFHYLKNAGTPTQPKFIKWKGVGNPFYFTAYDDGATPAFSDIDKDGDSDMLLGILDGTFRFYKNTNPTNAVPLSAQTSAWNPATKSGNPFFGVDLGDYASPFFIDLDNDNDDDLIIGTSYSPFSKSIYYYVNDGSGTFTASSLTGINPVGEAVTPIFIDIDNDGNLDILTGEGSGIIRFFKRTGQTSFEEKSGTANPFNGIDKGEHSSPTAADFDNDGDLDIVIAWEGASVDLSYYENKGNGVFEEKLRFDNPFDGFDAGSSASPFFTDVDNDGDQDVIVGDRTSGGVTKVLYYRNDSGTFLDKTAESIFAGLTIETALTPSFIDFDGDGDKDLLGGVDNGTHGSIVYFKNTGGLLVEQDFATGPFSAITTEEEATTDFVDIDNDGDYDLFISDVTGDFYEQHYFVRYFKNTGTKETPVFTEMMGTENPLSQVDEQHMVYPRFVDIDNDGDQDAIVGEAGGVVENEDGNEFSFYENTGTKTNPVFTYRDDLIQQGTNPYNPSPAFVDYDNDGDKDIFIGDVGGNMSLYKNQNQAAIVGINPNPLNVSELPTFVDPTITITDNDNDMLVEVIVTITNYGGNETLTFTPASGVIGSFNSGTIHFTGVASAATYQTLLRSVKLDVAPGSTGRRRTGENATVSKTVSIQIKDADATTSPAVSRLINFVSNEAPVFADNSLTVNVGNAVAIDLKTLVSDANGNINFNSFTITVQPTSGAAATIDSNGNLTINYANINFAGIETLSVQVSDTDGATDASTITITVLNAAPVITPVPITGAYSSTVTINLLALVSDADNNLDAGSIQLIGSPASNASAYVQVTSPTSVNLTVNYTGMTFSGTDQITVRACDKVGACSDGLISVVVEPAAAIAIYNAVAPNSSGDNKFFRILNIPPDNKVTVFNRWGDVVYKVAGYDNETAGKRFEGLNNHGSALPSGTYFYKIEYQTPEESKTLTGYLSLKQ
jgi:gliding motility-associated-like protein